MHAMPAGVHHNGSVPRSRRRMARLAGGCDIVYGGRLPLYGGGRKPARARYLLPRIKVGARPATVEKPVAPTGRTQVEQPFTFPRNVCGCTSTNISRISTEPYRCNGKVHFNGGVASCTT